MIPQNITKQHIQNAILEIDKNGVRKGRHSSTYDLRFEGKYYPPKLVLSIANRFANGIELEPKDFEGGKDTSAFELLKNKGFEIIQKKDPIKSLIENYKEHISKTQLKGEIYKWKLLSEFNGRPNTAAIDFYKEIKEIKFGNLIYPMGIGVINHLAKDKPEELRSVFKYLFNNKLDLYERVNYFNKETLRIYRNLGETLNHHQDERTIATYLTFHQPTEYTFYKSSYYKKYCKLIGVNEADRTKKYIHYLDLINQLIENYIKPDIDLINQVKKLLPGYYNGINHNLLAQDIIYQMIDLESEKKYWIFQGNPKVYDFESALKQETLSDWTVSKHKENIKIGDKVIIWITGNNAGCYALAEVSSEPHSKKTSSDDHLWNEEHQSELKVDIKITHNLINNPILKTLIDSTEKLKELKVGNQGTNFSATQDEYETLLELAENKKTTKYWLYAPGENAIKWDEFYNSGIMGLGWDEIGDLNDYSSKEEITTKLQELEKTTGSKKNDSTANYEFKDLISIGDIIIAKKGRGELLGYGVVTSDYFFDTGRTDYQSCRKVDWKTKGNWKTDHTLALKTLTDITKYPSSHSDYNTYYNQLLGIMTEKNSDKYAEMKYSLNTILYGPPGTGKTFNTVLRAAEIIENRNINSYDEARKIFTANLHNRIEFITFHQNYSYEDFIQGLRPETDNSSSLTFEKKDGVFKKIEDRALRNIDAFENPQKAKKDFDIVFKEIIQPLNDGSIEEIEIKMKKSAYFLTEVSEKTIEFRKNIGDSKHTLSINTLRKMYENESNDIILGGLQPYYNPLLDLILEKGKSNISNPSKENYVIIIDEINRANISRVFGELITLIEPDKRSNGKIPLEAKLPSGDTFMVPSNLYIIGTMNTADKSIALLDIALRRRFEFESMYPLYEIDGNEIYDKDILFKINERIIELKGHDFQIGHSYFMNENKDLAERMNKKVIPLLLEYFMNDKKEVKGILDYAGLEVDEKSWPLKISGKRG